jgi:DNA polymerase III epsilon subunit-like protein
MAAPDNPVQNVLDGLLSSKDRPRVGEYLLKLSQIRSAAGLSEIDLDRSPSTLTSQTDPFGIIRKYREFDITKTPFGPGADRIRVTEKFQEVASRISSFMEIGGPGAAPLKTDLQKRLHAAFGRLAQVPGIELLQGSGGKELYIGSVQLGFVPLPIQGKRGSLEGGIVQIGSKRRGAYQAMVMGGTISERSYSEIYYNKFAETVERLGVSPKVSGISNVKSPLVIFDLETTGTTIKGPGGKTGQLSLGADQEIIQFSATRFEGGKTRRLNLYITPEGKIEYKGHGLTKRTLRKKGAVSLQSAASEIDDFLRGATLAGHGIKGFDLPVLQANLAKAGINLDLANQGIVDTLEIERALRPGQPATLGAAFKRARGKTLKNAHNAAVDTAATASLLRKQLSEVLGPGFDKNLALLGEEGLSKGINTLLQTLGPTMSAQTVIQSLDRLKNTVIGFGSTGKQITLNQLLATPERIRGMSDTGLTAMYKGQEAIVLEETFGSSDIFKRRKEFLDARRTISQITKSRGVSVPEVEFLNRFRVGGKISAGQAIRAAYSIVDRYTEEDLPAMYAKLGITGLQPLTKADSLVEAHKNLVVSATSARRIFGTRHSIRAQQKGLQQLKKAAPITAAEARRIMRAGGRPVPYFMTEAELAETPKGVIAMKRPSRTLVVDFNNAGLTQIFTQDAGALMTPKGLQATARIQHIGQIKIKGAGQIRLKAIQTLTGIDPFDPMSEGVLDIGRGEFGKAADLFVTNKQLSKRELAIRRLIFRHTAEGRIPTAAYGYMEAISRRGQGPYSLAGIEDAPPTVSSVFEQGTLRLNLRTSKLVSSASVGLVSATTRLTGAAARADNLLAGDLNKLASMFGVEKVIAKSDFQKMDVTDIFLENFYGLLERNNLTAEFQHLLGKSKAVVAARGGYTIGLAASKFEGAKRAMRVVKEIRRKGVTDPRYAAIADQMLKKAGQGFMGVNRIGTATSLAGLELSNYASGATLVDIPEFVRSDQRLDTNMGNRIKITLGKFKTLAQGSMLLGYKDALEDPLVRDLGFNFKMFGWDPKKSDFVLQNEHPIRKFLTALADPESIKVTGQEVVTIKNGQLYLGDRALKALPDIKELSSKGAGVPRELLEGTILDPDIGDFLYLDLGKKKKLNLLGKDLTGKNILGGMQHRYIPIPKKLLRVEKGPEGRIIAGRTHGAFALLKMLSAVESGRDLTKEMISEAMTDIFDSLGGKKGLLSKMHTIQLDTGYSARLVPQQSTLITEKDLLSPWRMFEGGVSREQLLRSLQTRRGSIPESEFQRLTKVAKEENVMYSMFMADPAQRGGHMSVFKLRLLDSPIAANAPNKMFVAQFGLDIQMSPLAFKYFERDTDNDRIAIQLLGSGTKELRSRLARQVMAVAPAINYFKKEMAKVTQNIARTAAEEIPVLSDILGAFIGQKSFASLGYSQVRPTVERILPSLVEGPEMLKLAGARIGSGKRAIAQSELDSIRSMLMGGIDTKAGLKFAREQVAGSASLGAYLFQSGVKKGASKKAQRELNIALIDIADSARQSFVLDDVLTSSYKAFSKFIESADTSRIFEAGKLLNRADQATKSLPKVLEGLISGFQQGTDEYLRAKAAALMSMTVGVGYGLSSKIPSIGTVAGFAEDTSIYKEKKQIFKRIFKPLAGIVEKVTGTGKAISPQTGGTTTPPGVTRAKVPQKPTFSQRMSNVKTDLMKDLSALSESKYLKPSLAIAGGMAVVGLLNRVTAPDVLSAPLPPPADTSYPTDRGPSLPSFKPAPRINTSGFTPSASRSRQNQRFGTIKTNFFEPRMDNRVVISDNTSSRQNSWLIRRQMERESESDFAY